MKLAVFAYSRQGCETARRVMAALPEWDGCAFAPQRICPPDFSAIEKPSQPFYGAQFHQADALVFVGSCGIAVREIAPHLTSKTTDPAVVCVDETARFAVSLLSGHIGGANALAEKIASELGAIPVITTATDRNGRFSVDRWAAENGLAIDDMALAKAVSAAVLEGDVPLCADFPVVTPLPSGLTAGESGDLGIAVTCRTDAPFSQTLRLIPQVLHIGLGCRRGTAKETIAQAVKSVLTAHRIDARSIKLAASIDLKRDEAGLLDFCRQQGWDIRFYSPEALQAVEGDFTASEFVSAVTGVDNVCERAALADADELWIKKTAVNGVTVALAAEKWEVRFG